MKMFDAKIWFQIDKGHKDYALVPEKMRNSVLTYEDRYTFTDALSDSKIRQKIRKDLLLVAGGGYDWEHVVDPVISIQEV